MKGYWRRKWQPTPVFLPGKLPGGRLQSTGSQRVGQSSVHTGEGNGNPLQCSCLENPRDWGAWWAAVSGVAQSWTRLKRLSSRAAHTHTHKGGIPFQFHIPLRTIYYGYVTCAFLVLILELPVLLRNMQSIQNTAYKLQGLIKQVSEPTAAAAKSLQSCPTLCDPIDGSPPGSAVPGILQTRTLEWGAIAFSSQNPLLRSNSILGTLLKHLP